MKIAFLTTDNREQLKQYDKPIPYFGPAPTAVLEGLALLDDRLEVHVISCTKQKMAAPKMLAANIWFHQPHVPHLGWGRSLFLGCALAVKNTLRIIQPDIVHGQGTERDCAISTVLSGYPNVLTIHGNMRAVARNIGAKMFSYYWFASQLEKFALRHTNGVLCNSEYTEHEVGNFPKQTWRVPNCLRTPFLNPRKLGTIRERSIVILGAIITYKQSLEILRMWMDIITKTGDVKLVFIGSCGDSEYALSFKKLLQCPSLYGRAEHIDWLECEDLIQALDSSRGMIHFPTEETFGLAVAEGLARNLKLFASLTGGVPDVAAGCDGVEFFLPDEWQKLADQVVVWIAEGMPTPECSNTVLRRFSPMIVAQQHLEIYELLLTV